MLSTDLLLRISFINFEEAHIATFQGVVIGLAEKCKVLWLCLGEFKKEAVVKGLQSRLKFRQ